MKKHYTFSLLFTLLPALFVGLLAQNYQITFTGSGMSTAVGTIQAWNLTADTSVTLNGTDTLLLLKPMSIEKTISDQINFSVYPNPSNGHGTINLFQTNQGMVSLDVIDLSGKTVVNDRRYLSQGGHTYLLGGLKEGLYFIRMHGNGNTQSAKWIISGTEGGAPFLNYNGTDVAHPGFSLKLTEITATKSLPFEDGDQLLFQGKSGNYTTIVTLIPTSSQSVDFGFVSCTDLDNNHYPVVNIGTQTWMAANLKTTKYADGTPIPEVTDANSWSNVTTPAYCWYNNDPATGTNYGALYKWYTIGEGDLCPTGWSVPNVADWTALITYLGGDTIAGGKLKETGTVHWDTLMTGTSNASGFTAIPAGLRSISGGAFQGRGNTTYFWTSEDYSANFAHMRYLKHDSNSLISAGNNKGNGFSVRCIKD